MYLRDTFTTVVIAVCWILSSCLRQQESITSTSFHKPPSCPAQLPRGYMQVSQVVNSSKIFSCIIICASSPLCNSVVFDRISKTCYLSQQVATPDCLNMENAVDTNVFFQKKDLCRNGGTPRGDMCECVPGYIGQTCELGPMRDCNDYFNVEQIQGAIIRVIRPTESDFFPVNCYNDMLTVLYRQDNNVNFTRPWLDYREGFGNLNDNHWLGLEKLHILTSQNRTYALRIQVTLKNNTKLFTVYNNITVKKEKFLYQLNFDSLRLRETKDILGDCLSGLRGANFSTYDNDNDENNSVNCAGRHQGGWWFRGNTCSTCNPTGQLLQPANGLRTGVDSEVFWIKDLVDVVPHKISVRIGITP